jgi:hypothetical protein
MGKRMMGHLEMGTESAKFILAFQSRLELAPILCLNFLVSPKMLFSLCLFIVWEKETEQKLHE